MPGSLIIQVPRDGPLDRQLSDEPTPGLAGGAVVVQPVSPDAQGNLDPPAAGEIVLSVPSPESLSRDADEVRRVLTQAGEGAEPLVIVVEVAEELREDELAPVLAGARRASRPVILRVIRSDSD